jgi:hypothetical protein
MDTRRIHIPARPTVLTKSPGSTGVCIELFIDMIRVTMRIQVRYSLPPPRVGENAGLLCVRLMTSPSGFQPEFHLKSYIVLGSHFMRTTLMHVHPLNLRRLEKSCQYAGPLNLPGKSGSLEQLFWAHALQSGSLDQSWAAPRLDHACRL